MPIEQSWNKQQEQWRANMLNHFLNSLEFKTMVFNASEEELERVEKLLR